MIWEKTKTHFLQYFHNLTLLFGRSIHLNSIRKCLKVAVLKTRSPRHSHSGIGEPGCNGQGAMFGSIGNDGWTSFSRTTLESNWVVLMGLIVEACIRVNPSQNFEICRFKIVSRFLFQQHFQCAVDAMPMWLHVMATCTIRPCDFYFHTYRHSNCNIIT